MYVALLCQGRVVSVLRSGSGKDVDDAVSELVSGVTSYEARLGYTSWFGEPTSDLLKDVTVSGSTVVLDFDPRLAHTIPNASTATGSEQFLGQITRTVSQFADLQQVELAFAGDFSALGEWLQRGCIRIPL